MSIGHCIHGLEGCFRSWGKGCLYFFPSRRLIRARQWPGSRSNSSIRYPLYSFIGGILMRELKPGFRTSCDCTQDNLGAGL
jgi:hypothetical protein